MLHVGDDALVAFGELLNPLPVFLLMVLRVCDVPLYPALGDGSEVFGEDLESREVVLWFERSDYAGDGYTLANHALIMILLIRRCRLHSKL